MPTNPVADTAASLDNFWLGFRYTIIAMPEGFSLTDVADIAGFLTVGVQEIDLPQVSVETVKVPSLSTLEDYIPVKAKYGTLKIRAPVIKQTALYDRIEAQINSISDPNSYKDTVKTFIIIEYDIQPGPSHVALDVLKGLFPLRAWVCKGCQAIQFNPANARSIGTDKVPLEELVLQVSSLTLI